MYKEQDYDDLERRLSETPFISGNLPTSDDFTLFYYISKAPPSSYPNLHAWYMLVKQFSPSVRALWPKSFYKDKTKCLKCTELLIPTSLELRVCPKCYDEMSGKYQHGEKNYTRPDYIDSYLWLGDMYSSTLELPLVELGIRRILVVAPLTEVSFPNTFAYLNVSLEDACNENLLAKLDEMINFIEYGVENEEGVLVHCVAGVSRSASVVIAYLMKKYKWEFNLAKRFVEAKRDCIAPNMGFVKQLRKWEQSILS